jgi:ABC-type tungstate transport system substrate-binding protein
MIYELEEITFYKFVRKNPTKQKMNLAFPLNFYLSMFEGNWKRIFNTLLNKNGQGLKYLVGNFMYVLISLSHLPCAFNAKINMHQV